MRDEVTVLGHNGKSFIRIHSRCVEIVYNDKTVNPIGVISIMKGIQIELGRPLKHFIASLRLIRRPLAVQKVIENGNTSSWKLIRIATGEVKEKVVCTFTVIDGLIKVVAFNTDLSYDDNYKKHEGLSVFHQVTAGEVLAGSNISKALSSIMVLTKLSNEQLKVKSNKRKITVYTNLKDSDVQYRYLFLSDRRGYFHLTSIGIVA